MPSTPNIQPTQGFILVEFRSRAGTPMVIFVPDGHRTPTDDVVVLAVGPDVPKIPPIEPGTILKLRGDAKLFEIPGENKSIAMLDYRSIMGVYTPDKGEGTEPLPFTDEEIREITRPNGAMSDDQAEALRHG